MENASLDEFLDDSESEGKSEPDEGSGGESGARNDGESGDGEESENQGRARNNERSGDGAEPENQGRAQNNEMSGDGAESSREETARNDTPEDRDGSDSTESIDPPTPTSRWQSDGQDCVVCERGVRRLWSDDGRLVCADCKDWA